MLSFLNFSSSFAHFLHLERACSCRYLGSGIITFLVAQASRFGVYSRFHSLYNAFRAPLNHSFALRRAQSPIASNAQHSRSELSRQISLKMSSSDEEMPLARKNGGQYTPRRIQYSPCRHQRIAASLVAQGRLEIWHKIYVTRPLFLDNIELTPHTTILSHQISY